MKLISLKQWAAEHGVAERTARNYCAHGKIADAVLIGKTWSVPYDAEVPRRNKKFALSPLLVRLRNEKNAGLKNGIYHKIQIDLTYSSNHIEGSRLTHDQTRYIFETNTVGVTDGSLNVDDIIETINHFRAIDYIIDKTDGKLTEIYIKELHRLLKSGTSDNLKDWFNVGDYKKLPNEVGGSHTTAPEHVGREIKALLKHYNAISSPSLEDIIDFHHRFECIHPFQDGNGRVGRLVMFRECLRTGHVPFIISDELRMFYYRGLHNWPEIKGFLLDTILSAQDEFKDTLRYFRIPFNDN